MILHGPHKKRCVPQFYCCVCIRCRSNLFTEPLPNNDTGNTQTRTARLSHGATFIFKNWGSTIKHDETPSQSLNQKLWTPCKRKAVSSVIRSRSDLRHITPSWPRRTQELAPVATLLHHRKEAISQSSSFPEQCISLLKHTSVANQRIMTFKLRNQRMYNCIQEMGDIYFHISVPARWLILHTSLSVFKRRYSAKLIRWSCINVWSAVMIFHIRFLLLFLPWRTGLSGLFTFRINYEIMNFKDSW
jgi:hypothetical protein